VRDKPYLTDLSNMSEIVKKTDTKNYQLTLQDKGVIASSKGNYSYNLQMPSYADGRICCDGDDCAKLNKNYPSCKGFTYEPSPDSCAGTITPVKPESEPEPEPEPEPLTPCEKDPTSCECNPNQEKCCPAGEVWKNGKCVPPSCDSTHSEGARSYDLCACGDGYSEWHCGSDTGFQWTLNRIKECPASPQNGSF